MMKRRPQIQLNLFRAAAAFALVVAMVLLLPFMSFGQSSFTLFTNAPPNPLELEAALVAEIAAADVSIDAALYSLEREAVVDALVAAKNRAVAVRVVTETDNYESDRYAPAYLRLEAAGIPVVTDNAGGGGSALMHNKFFIFDAEKVWTGSYNPTNSGTIANSNHALLIDDSALAGAYTVEFEEMFVSYYFGAYKLDNTTHYFTIDSYGVESYFSPSDRLRGKILAELDAAVHSVYFLVFTFTDTQVGDKLVSLHNSSVKVMGAIEEGQKNVSGSEYSKLFSAGVPVRLDDYPGLLHHKLMIIDPGYENAVVITGSSNWTNSAFTRNDEDILILRNPPLANLFYGLFEDIYFNHCRDEGGAASGAIVISEIMSAGEREKVASDDRSNWAESDEIGGSPREWGDPDTLPPVIVHTPVERAQIGRPLNIHCLIYDPNDPEMYSAREPTLYYRQTGEFNYQTVYMGAFFGEYAGTIPAVAVTTDGVEYFISARDWSYNLATSPPLPLSPWDNPYQVEVVDNPDAVIRFTEIMYDPGLEAEDESIYEWVEIHNTFSNQTVNLSGWEFTNDRGSYFFPPDSSIGPNEYQVLCKTELGPSGAFTRYLYGPESIGDITLRNSLGLFTDRLILRDPTGLTVEEVAYSANWGASNVRGPNNHTLEKIDPDGPDDETNWMYSMAHHGTPGEASSPHFIFNVYETESGYSTRPGIRIEPSLINPGIDEAVISYRLDRACDVTVKVYNPPDGTPPELCFDSAYYLVTLLDDEPQSENMNPAFSSHTVAWDGTYSGQTAVGNLRVVVSAAAGGSVCVADANDTMMTTKYHGFTPDTFNVYSQQPTVLDFYQSKPAFITIDISKKIKTGLYEPIRSLVSGVAYPFPVDGKGNRVLWDGREDDGRLVAAFDTFLAEIQADDIFGNVLIARPPLRIYAVRAEPRSFFNPGSGVQTIRYTLNQDAIVTFEIRDGAGGLVATPLEDVQQAAGEHQVQWDGAGNTGEGIYNFTINAKASGQKVRFSGKIALYYL